MGPLAGIKVLDLSRILAGPWATQLLADLGAEVIKVERPEGGDDTRAWGPPYLKDRDGRKTSESAYFLSANRGKRSVAIDFGTEDGSRLVRELALQSDVLIENYKVGGLEKYRLAWKDLAPLHPGLIYCSISAFGQSGPAAAKPGYDAMIQAMGGLMSVTGVPDGEPGGGPQKVGVAVSDLLAGMYASTAIIAALYERQRSGCGQFIDLALLDTQVAATRQPESELPGLRRCPAPSWNCAPEHRALPGVRHGRRSSDARNRQRSPVRTLLRSG